MREVCALRVGPVCVYAFGGLCALCMLAGFVYLWRKLPQDRAPQAGRAAALTVWTAGMGLLAARAFFCAVSFYHVFYDPMTGDSRGIGAFLYMQEGGLEFSGFVLGMIAGLRIGSARIHASFDECADLTALPGALGAVLLYACQPLFGMGEGRQPNAAWTFFSPLCVPGEWEDEWRFNLAFIEAVLAGAVLLYLICTEKKRSRYAVGTRGKWTAAALCLCRVFTESLRANSESLKMGDFHPFGQDIGFLRFTQLGAMLIAVFLCTRLCLQSTAGKKEKTGFCVYEALSFLAGVAVEFALDKSVIDNTLLYAVFAAFLTGLALWSLRLVSRPAWRTR